MDHSTFYNKADLLQAEIDKARIREAQWTAETRVLLIRVLKAITAGATILKWFVQEGDNYVNIQLDKRPIINPVSNTKALLEGGQLTYCQGFNGKIWALILFPYAEDIIERVEHHHIATFEPQEIKPELVQKHVEMFLDAMLKWEGSSIMPIGFKLSEN